MAAETNTEATTVGAAYYADGASVVTATILENEPLARDTYRMRIDAAEIAQQILPGQFLMVRLAGFDDPMLGRPFALYDVVLDAAGQPTAVDFVYLVHGKLTTQLARCGAGQQVEVWGPLGNGFCKGPAGNSSSPTIPQHSIFVAGGIGQTPFLALGKQRLGRQAYGDQPLMQLSGQSVTLCYGVRSQDLLAGADDFRAAGLDLRIASDDGSIGHHGLVTDLLRELLAEQPEGERQVVCCGPEPMMQAVAEICRETGTPCQVSLETPMACGIGICFSCVAKVKQADGSWDYKRTCVEGPVFDAESIEW